jgi:hypothetical protein
MIARNTGSLLVLVVAMLSAPGLHAAEPLQLRYTHPAARWTEALPVGQATLGPDLQ